MSDLALLGVFAHPDDEQIISGAYAQAASERIRTGLVCATRGELGEIASPELATQENLGRVRENELRAACAVLGIKHLWFLDYRDSGMMGTAGNDDPAAFYRVNISDAVGKVVNIVRDFKPTVMVTFDPTGGYGHPDHITICKVATEAFDAAGDARQYPEAGEPWQPARLYYAGFPRSMGARFGEIIKELGIDTPMARIERTDLGIDDATITHRLAVHEWLALKEKSLLQHRTQNDPNSFFARLPKEWINEFRSTEHYALVTGTPLPKNEDSSQDLFAGLR